MNCQSSGQMPNCNKHKINLRSQHVGVFKHNNDLQVRAVQVCTLEGNLFVSFRVALLALHSVWPSWVFRAPTFRPMAATMSMHA